MKPKEFHSKLDDARIVEAIAKAEARTTGEIRVFISHHETVDPVASAHREFDRLGMRSTAQRNGVLLFFAPASRRFAVVGDQGIHDKCGEGFWATVRDAMEPLLREQRFTDAVLAGVAAVGHVLAQHFPGDGKEPNELSNEVATD